MKRFILNEAQKKKKLVMRLNVFQKISGHQILVSKIMYDCYTDSERNVKNISQFGSQWLQIFLCPPRNFAPFLAIFASPEPHKLFLWWQNLKIYIFAIATTTFLSWKKIKNLPKRNWKNIKNWVGEKSFSEHIWGENPSQNPLWNFSQENLIIAFWLNLPRMPSTFRINFPPGIRY